MCLYSAILNWKAKIGLSEFHEHFQNIVLNFYRYTSLWYNTDLKTSKSLEGYCAYGLQVVSKAVQLQGLNLEDLFSKNVSCPCEFPKCKSKSKPPVMVQSKIWVDIDIYICLYIIEN